MSYIYPLNIETLRGCYNITIINYYILCAYAFEGVIYNFMNFKN